MSSSCGIQIALILDQYVAADLVLMRTSLIMSARIIYNGNWKISLYRLQRIAQQRLRQVIESTCFILSSSSNSGCLCDLLQ
jgi:hypothetical protein